MRVLALVILLTAMQVARSSAQVAPAEDRAVQPAPLPDAEPPTVVVPAPSLPGYAHLPVSSAPQARVASGDELAQIDARLYELKVERSKYGIGGPIAMMAVGFVGALALVEVALVQVLVTSADTWAMAGTACARTEKSARPACCSDSRPSVSG